MGSVTTVFTMTTWAGVDLGDTLALDLPQLHIFGIALRDRLEVLVELIISDQYLTLEQLKPCRSLKRDLVQK